jgi:3-hydroxyisobutyrate dehydrogenase-like beta-hydroxyacid dehydrogenase
MVHELKYDEETNIVVLTFKNHVIFTDVASIVLGVDEILKGKSYRQVLVLMSEEYKVENRETREALSKELSKLDVSEVAFVGLGSATRMVAKVLLKTGMIKMNGAFFKSKQDAIEWLKSKRK